MSSLALTETGSAGTGPDGGKPVELHLLAVLLTNNSALTCSFVQMKAGQGNIKLASVDDLALLVASETGPVGPGTYTVGTKTSAAQATFESTDASCNQTDAQATGGTIVISSVSGSSVSGTYDVTFPSGPLSGSFQTSFCTEPDAGKSDAAAQCISP
jgi:hypothetical protein